MGTPFLGEYRYRVRTGYRYAYGTPWVRTDDVPIFLFFILQWVHAWYSYGTRVVLLWYTNPKKYKFFSFLLFIFLFIGRFMFFICLI
jgi:hypothetical protein